MYPYQVVVGNVGIVYDGNDALTATAIFVEYPQQSASGVGRAAGGHVALIVDGEVADENECPDEPNYPEFDMDGSRFDPTANKRL